MKFVDLSQHLRELRFRRSGREMHSAMTAIEVWKGALECQHNGIGQIVLKETALPRPFDGMFARMKSRGEPALDLGVVFLGESVPTHWVEFVVIKELMHCWSPKNTFVGDPDEVAQLVTALNMRSTRYTANVASDLLAIQAAAEVILPHYVVDRALSTGVEIIELGHRHGLHPEVAELICRHDILSLRRNGSL